MSKNEKGFETTYIPCECSSKDHLLVLTLEDYEDKDLKYEPLFVIEYQLNMHHGFFKRIWIAFRYVFNFYPTNKSWDCSMISASSVEKLESAVKSYKSFYNKYLMNKNGECIHCEGRGGVSNCNACGKCASCKQVNQHSDECQLARSSLIS
jgi:hypothetical protein